jgi:flagellar basal body P-ring protein FlgI
MAFYSSNILGCAFVATLAGLALAGCQSEHKSHVPTAAQDHAVAPPVYPALRGTIGEVAVLTSTAPMRVEGYGIVADLPGTGSGEMPPPVRQMLTEELYKAHAGSPTFGTEDLRPEEILNSKRISAVSVVGYAPPLSPKGTTFDLVVKALPGSQTTSLEQGLLWTCDLKLIGLTEAGTDTRAVAKGRGPIFCNPFIKRVDAQGELIHRNVRTGRVMAGGMLLEDMPANLQLYTPSYRITNQIQRAINGRFSNMPPYASAISDSTITLSIPEDYRDNPREFINIVMHMYMAQDVPGFTERKTLELLAALRDPDAPQDQLGTALEGLGRTILPLLQNAYTSDSPVVRFYSARAGAGLGDSSAIVVLESFARNNASPFQYQAIQAISRNGDSLRTNTVLTELLSSDNMRVRVLAYEGLLRLGSPKLNSFSVGRKFIVDRVVTDGPAVIYATQTGTPRIALIGKKFTLPPGTLYMSADEMLTVSLADNDDPANAPATAPGLAAPGIDPAAGNADPDPVKLYYRGGMGMPHVLIKSNPSLGVVIAKLGYAPDPRAPDYNPKQPYIGASYQRVLEMLEQLCKEQVIDATFVMQQTDKDEFSLAALADRERPESDTPQPDAVPDKHNHDGSH